MQYKQYTPIMKALSDETRLKIVDMLSGGELCACKILEAFNITQPTLSYHMKTLTQSGLVIARRDGAWMRYSLNAQICDELTHFFSELVTSEQKYQCSDCAADRRA